MTTKLYAQILSFYKNQNWSKFDELSEKSLVKYPKKPNLKILAIILESLGNKNNKITNKIPKPKKKKQTLSNTNKSRKKVVRTDIKSPKGGFGFTPPFKWAGSKRKMLKYYQDIFFPPKPIKTFVDMFCGSTLVSMWVATKYPQARIILNDQNKELIDMYLVIRNTYNKFEKELLKIVNGMPDTSEKRKKYYYDIRTMYCHEYIKEGTIKTAARLYFMLKTNFGGLWKSGKHCNYRYSTSPGNMTESSKFFDIDPIRKFSLFLGRCEIKNGDFSELGEYAGEGTYYYADPPYISSSVDYEGEYEFGIKDQIDLINFLRDVGSKGSWFAESNRDLNDGFWEEHYPVENIYHIKGVKYTAGRNDSTQFDEIFVTNF